MQTGKRVVVDVDLAKFFDRVNHSASGPLSGLTTTHCAAATNAVSGKRRVPITFSAADTVSPKVSGPRPAVVTGVAALNFAGPTTEPAGVVVNTVGGDVGTVVEVLVVGLTPTPVETLAEVAFVVVTVRLGPLPAPPPPHAAPRAARATMTHAVRGAVCTGRDYPV